MDKKVWIKPELVSLTRCKPEEAVLSACKFWSSSGDPTTYCTGCLQQENGQCTWCEQHASS